MKFVHFVKISNERIGILIGKQGKNKKELEKLTGVKIKINKNGEVELIGEDGFTTLQVANVIRAIDLGFSYDIAKKIILNNMSFEIIDLKEYVKSPNHLKRILGRIIGKKGLFKKELSQSTSTYIVVSEKDMKIGIIGYLEDLEHAINAIMDIIRGKPHGKVYRKLERLRKKKKENLKDFLWKKEI